MLRFQIRGGNPLECCPPPPSRPGPTPPHRFGCPFLPAAPRPGLPSGPNPLRPTACPRLRVPRFSLAIAGLPSRQGGGTHTPCGCGCVVCACVRVYSVEVHLSVRFFLSMWFFASPFLMGNVASPPPQLIEQATRNHIITSFEDQLEIQIESKVRNLQAIKYFFVLQVHGQLSDVHLPFFPCSSLNKVWARRSFSPWAFLYPVGWVVGGVGGRSFP